jgi:hypothetical protein
MSETSPTDPEPVGVERGMSADQKGANIPPPSYTRKQMGDACEMLVAAELTLAGIPALKVPDNRPGYDVIAQPLNGNPQLISVTSRTFKRGAAYVEYNTGDKFDWLASSDHLAGRRTRRRAYLGSVPMDRRRPTIMQPGPGARGLGANGKPSDT